MLYRTYRPGTIKVELPGVTCRSAEVERRLQRIAENYEYLDELLNELEAKLPSPSLSQSPPGESTVEEDGSPVSHSRRLRRRKPR